MFGAHVLKIKDNKSFGKFVWPDIDDIYSAERVRVVKILVEQEIVRWSRIVELECAQEVQSNE